MFTTHLQLEYFNLKQLSDNSLKCKVKSKSCNGNTSLVTATSRKRKYSQKKKKKSYLLYTANDDLCQRIDQRLHDLTGIDCAENPTPEIQAVDILPVINRLEILLQKREKHRHKLENVAFDRSSLWFPYRTYFIQHSVRGLCALSREE